MASQFRAIYFQTIGIVFSAGHKYGCRKSSEISVFEYSYKSVSSSLNEVIRFKATFTTSKISRTTAFRRVTQKPAEIQAPSIAKQLREPLRTLDLQKF